MADSTHGPDCTCPRCVGFTSETAAEVGKRGGEAGSTHGARSDRHLRPRVDRILVQLRRVAPTAGESADELAFERLAWLLARAEALDEWLDINGLVDDRGEVRSAVKQLGTIDNSVRKLMAELGLTAGSRRALLEADGIPLSQVQAGFREQQAAAYELLGRLVAEGLSGAALQLAFRERLPALVAERLGRIGVGELEAGEVAGEVIAETDEPVDVAPQTMEGAVGDEGEEAAADA